MKAQTSHKHRYAQRFTALQAQGRKAFIPFTLLGWPSRETSLAIVKTMIAQGVSALELGLAFSDPMADGPIIQAAATETLASGFRVADAFQLLQEIRALDEAIPIGLLVYYNMVLAQGTNGFFAALQAAGVDGVLIADLPPEASAEVQDVAHAYGIDLIYIISPLTTDARLAKILAHAGGFLYAVSRLGTTGVEERYDADLQALLQRVKAQTNLPVCVGFGISTPEQARHMLSLGADGVITGSRVIQLVREASADQYPAILASFFNEMLAIT